MLFLLHEVKRYAKNKNGNSCKRGLEVAGKVFHVEHLTERAKCKTTNQADESVPDL